MPSRDPDASSRHWLIERRVRVYPRIFLVMFVLAVPLYAMTFDGGVDARGQAPGSDFVAFWSAARLAVEGAGLQAWDLQRLYDVQLERHPGLSGPTAWVYPPTTLLLVAPLGLLPYGAAFAAWTAAGIVAFLAPLRRITAGVRGSWPLILAFPGLWLGVAQGQTQFFVGALMGGALLLLGPRPVLAGVLVGLLCIKPHLAVLFPFVLLAAGLLRTFVAAAVTAVAAMAVGVAVYGSDSITAWLGGMSLVGDAVDSGALPVHKFVTPYAALRTLGAPMAPSLVLQGVVTLVVVVLVCVVWRRTEDLGLRGSALVLGTFLATPYAADYDLALLALPIAWLALAGLAHGWRRGERNLLVTAWMLPLLAAPVAAATHLTIAPILVALLLRVVWVRTSQDAAAVLQPASPRGRT